MSCCAPKGYARLFGKRAARRDVRRYEKDGLDDTGARMVAFLRERGVEGATVLEIGGGVGALQLELLEAGAAHATNLELSPEYEEAAGQLLRERNLEEQVDRHLGDVVADPALAEPADAVLMHRVVCCYPDYERLLGAAASHAKQALVFSHPPRNLASRAFLALQNLGLRLAGKEFRAFAHPPAAMLDVCSAHGFSATLHTGVVWQVEGLERSLRSRPPRRSP